MFIRQVKKQRSNSSKVFYQYTLAQTTRVNGKVRQSSILYLGSDPLLFDKVNRAVVLSILKSKIFGQTELFPAKPRIELERLALKLYDKYLDKYGADNTAVSTPPKPSQAEYHQVDLKGLKIEDCKSFGAEHLCVQVLQKLELRRCLKSVGMTDATIQKAIISIAARALFRASEYKTAQYLNENSSLLECLRYDKAITHEQLYAIADKLHVHQEAINKHLNERIDDMFGLQDKLVIFDISNTYFETSKRQSELADFGRSKEKRHDCPIVVFTGVINAEGFIRHSSIYHGKTADSTTLEQMINNLEAMVKTGVKRTVVIDAGIATEDNLETLRSKSYNYVCVSRKQIKQYPADELIDAVQVKNNKDTQTIKLKTFKPEDAVDTWMYVQSDEKRKKEQSILDKVCARFEDNLTTIKQALSKKNGTKKYDKVWERIGRAKEKHKSASGRYQINVKQKDDIAIDMTWVKKASKVKDDKAKGIYFIRTNLEG